MVVEPGAPRRGDGPADPDPRIRALEQALAAEQERVRVLEDELEQTTRGLLALTSEIATKNEEVQAMTGQLWQSARLAAVGEMAASVAHELNNPLAALSMRLEMILDRAEPDDPNLRTWRLMQGEVERMSRLVSNLLAFGRRKTAGASRASLREEVVQTMDLIGFHLARRNVTLHEEVEVGLPEVRIDPQQVRQVVLNLVTNAADALPSGGRVTIRARRVTRDGEAGVVLEVVDGGVGIPPEHLARVTEAFFTTKPEGRGTGLGLPICRRILQENGGRMEIESTVGVGTTVRVWLLPA